VRTQGKSFSKTQLHVEAKVSFQNQKVAYHNPRRQRVLGQNQWVSHSMPCPSHRLKGISSSEGDQESCLSKAEMLRLSWESSLSGPEIPATRRPGVSESRPPKTLTGSRDPTAPVLVSTTQYILGLRRAPQWNIVHRDKGSRLLNRVPIIKGHPVDFFKHHKL
jgi:hypothetical protein